MSRNFLSNRQHFAIVNDEKSSWYPVTNCIPQGSVLGPVLFVIYINDIIEEIQSHIFPIADDTKAFWVIKNRPSDYEILHGDIIKLCEWSR